MMLLSPADAQLGPRTRPREFLCSGQVREGEEMTRKVRAARERRAVRENRLEKARHFDRTYRPAESR
jgi:hypothetical protein